MLQFLINGKTTHQVTNRDGQIYLDDQPINWDIRQLPNGLISILHNNKSYTGIVESIDMVAKQVLLRINGQLFTVAVKEPIDQLLASMGLDKIAAHKAEPVKAPMPGMVLRILVEPGQQINKGDGLIVLEAMKMENILKANTNATVKSIKVSPRTAVEKGTVLIELE